VRGFPFVLEPVALAIHIDGGRVMQNTIEQRRAQYSVVGESGIPTAKR
jgi:hypothetical protein